MKITGRSGSYIVDINYDMKQVPYPGSDTSTYSSSKKVHIRFNTSAEMANFLRTTNDFTSGVTRNIDRGYKAVENKTTTKQPEIHIKSKGTGNTTDVLSSTYGL